MCKRYYVEVTGLDPEDGQQQLREAGIQDSAILVVETREDVISRAIKEVTGVGIDGILSHIRDHNAVSARTMYVHYCILHGDSTGSICKRMGRDRPRINYYARDYERKVFGDREFRHADQRVQQLLKEDPEWQPAKWEKPKRPKRRPKRRPRLVPKKVEPKDALQQKIQWI